MVKKKYKVKCFKNALEIPQASILMQYVDHKRPGKAMAVYPEEREVLHAWKASNTMLYPRRYHFHSCQIVLTLVLKTDFVLCLPPARIDFGSSLDPKHRINYARPYHGQGTEHCYTWSTGISHRF